MINSSNSSKGEGNTKPPPLNKKVKQISCSKGWCLTLNNYTQDEVNLFCSKVPEVCSKAIIGMEVSDSGTPHLQGWVELKIKNRPLTVFPFSKRAHWEQQRGSRTQNDKYCSKDGKVIIRIGFPKPLKALACEDNLYQWQQELCSVIEKDPDDRLIYWYWSKEGNVGKTTFAKHLHRKYGAICLGGKCADMKNGIIEYYKKNEHTPEAIVINIPRSFNNEYLSYTGIEEVKDMFFYSGKYEGGMVDGNPPHVFIFANEKPDIKKMSKDRWVIRQCDEPESPSSTIVELGDEVTKGSENTCILCGLDEYTSCGCIAN